VQQAAADALFLQYAPPPPHPGIVCMVDSGVDPNPDTTPAVVGSYSLQQGGDTADELAKLNPPIDGHPNGHGTYMAMVMAAPQNGWGMVGIAPTSVRVYNVKALPSGQGTFPFSYYDDALHYCQLHMPALPGLDVVNLSLGGAQAPSSSDLATLRSDVVGAHNHGLNVVAAAGNSGGALESPAAVNGVFAVGAADASSPNLGVFCSFSNRGPQLQVIAPGCGSQSGPESGGLDMAFEDDGSPAWGQGTSEASAEVSAVIASMRAYEPTITVSEAEQCVTSTEVRGGNLDVAQAFRACDLGAIVDQGNAAYADGVPSAGSQKSAPAPSTPPAILPAQTATPLVLPAPRLGPVTFKRRTLGVHALNLPTGARMTLRVARRIGSRYVTLARWSAAAAWARPHVSGWDRVVVRFVDPTGKDATSPTTTVARAPRAGHHLP
jgi:hypothetical protein